jgi:hypothetical protein
MEQVSSSWYGPDDGYRNRLPCNQLIAGVGSPVRVVAASLPTYPEHTASSRRVVGARLPKSLLLC